MFAEIKNNPGVLPKIVVFIYRFGQKIYNIKIFYFFWKIVETIFNKIFLNTEIHPACDISNGLKVVHPYGIIINKDSIIGSNALIRHQVTIGMNGTNKQCPIIGNNVDIGAGAKIIGGIKLGDRVKIGANAVVTKSFPDDAILVGVPAININKEGIKN